jgi:hypothetical protein
MRAVRILTADVAPRFGESHARGGVGRPFAAAASPWQPADIFSVGTGRGRRQSMRMVAVDRVTQGSRQTPAAQTEELAKGIPVLAGKRCDVFNHEWSDLSDSVIDS